MSFHWKLIPLVAVILVLINEVSSLTVNKSPPKKVVVAGAGSSVGLLVFKKLIKRPSDFIPMGLVRDYKGYQELRRIGAKPEQIRICNFAARQSINRVFDGAEKVVVCTTSVPKQKISYKVKNILRWLVGQALPPRPEDLFYRRKQSPYEIDYLGQKNIIDECVDAKVDHVVLLGVMGGYHGSKLNDIGRKSVSDDSKYGNVLKWKRAAERYLMQRRFFTIIHSATMTDEPGGQQEIVWDTDDALLRTPYKKIPKEDVAECIVQALLWKEAIGRSIDIASGPSKPSRDWLRFWARPGNCFYPADFEGFPAE